MKSTFKILFYVRKDKINAEGFAPINARITLDGDVVQFSTKCMVNPKIWDTRNCKAQGRSKEAEEVNEYLSHIQTELNNAYFELSRSREVVTPVMVRDFFLGSDMKQNTLLSIFREFCDKQEKLIGVDISQSTFNKFDLTYRRLQKFLKKKRNRNDIPIYQIDHDFVIDFHTFLKVDYRMSVNSSEKLIRIFKRITTLCFKTGITQKDPFAAYKIKKEKKERGYLTQAELQLIENFRTDSPRLEKVADIFIFSSYTGLDYSTLVSLKDEHIVTDENGVRVIVIERIKTQVVAQVPILPKAQAILDKYDEDRETAYLLPVMSNQKYNSYLKEIGAALGIEKKITTHLARHTFATTVTYANGVSIGAVSKMLGHTKLSTTEIYAKMMDRTVKDEMGKLAKVLEKKKKEHPQTHAC